MSSLKTMQLVYLTLGKQSFDAKDSDIPCSVFDSYDDYMASGIGPVGFVLESDSADSGLVVLKLLRGAIETFLLPVYIHGFSSDENELLSDGFIDTLHEAFAKAGKLYKEKEDLLHDQSEYAESAMLRVLAYLYLRPNKIIKPLQRWADPYLYSYPLIDIFSGEDQEASRILTNLKNRRFLRFVDLIDRVRHCPRCNFSHLNFIDTCPNCSSIEIEQKPFLHCFSCGTVAPQEQFLHGSGMTCPQCNAQLRHIGADYDRPLENYTCNDCSHFFQEPEIIAHCQNCGKKNTPDELVPRPVYSYQLTERGQHAVRTGELEDVYSLFDELQNINPVHFSYTVDWLLRLCVRHADELFSLAGIRIDNISQVHKKIGRSRLIELVDSYISRIREVLRTTDLTTRTVDDTIWILLPKTNSSNCEIVLKRILDLKSLTLQDEDIRLEFKSVTFSAPDNIIEGETGEQLLARVEGEME